MQSILENFFYDNIHGANMKKNDQYCCALLVDSIEDLRTCVGYSPSMREYYISLKDPIVVDTIAYCPWCGTKLPESLRDQYFDTLKQEYNIDNDIDAEEVGTLPAEFKTDAWWKKRGY